MSLLELLNIGTTSSTAQDIGFDLPPDSIIFFERESENDPIPSGFTVYEEANNRLIFGTTNTVEIGTLEGTSANFTNGAFPGPGLVTTSGGPHGSPTPALFRGVIYPGPPGPSPTIPVASITIDSGNHAGHTHVGALSTTSVPSTVQPPGRYIVPITNSSTVSQIPINAIIFSSSSSPGFQRKTFDTNSAGLYVGTTKNSRSKSGEVINHPISINPGGDHIHSSPASGAVPYTTAPTGKPGVVTTPRVGVPGGVHTHPSVIISNKIFEEFKHLLPFIATSSKTVKSGMIVMFKGASVPSGWKLCDGTNGTPDMNGFYLGYDNNENGHGVVKSGRRLGSTDVYPLTPKNQPGFVNHPTYYITDFPESTVLNATFPTETWTHSHLTNNGAIFRTNLPNQRHGPAPIPHSHVYPRNGFRMPLTFVPDRIKLVFIQKE